MLKNPKGLAKADSLIRLQNNIALVSAKIEQIEAFYNQIPHSSLLCMHALKVDQYTVSLHRWLQLTRSNELQLDKREKTNI